MWSLFRIININLLKFRALRLTITILGTLLCTHQSFAQSDNKIRIDTFSNYPDGIIDACGCYLCKNKKDFKNHTREYVLIKGDSTSCMKINGQFITFKTGYEKNLIKGTSENYELIIDIQSSKEIEAEGEVEIVTGVIILTDKRGRKKVQKFYGECGC